MGRFNKVAEADAVVEGTEAKDVVIGAEGTSLPEGEALTKILNSNENITAPDAGAVKKLGRISRAIADLDDDFPVLAKDKVAKEKKEKGAKKSAVILTLEVINSGLVALGLTLSKVAVSRGINVLDVHVANAAGNKAVLRTVMDDKFRTTNYSYGVDGVRLPEVEGKGVTTTAELILSKLGVIAADQVGLEEKTADVAEKTAAYNTAVSNIKKLAISEMKEGKFDRVVTPKVEETPVEPQA